MNNFKPRINKKYTPDSKVISSLDSKHDEYLKKFKDDEDLKIPKYREERAILIKNFNEKKSIEEKLDLKDKIKEINSKIKRLEASKKNYFLQNSKYVFGYFEDKKKIDEKKTLDNKNSNSKCLSGFFCKNNSKDNNINNLYKTGNRNISKYMLNIDPNYLTSANYLVSSNECQYCKIGELIPVENEGILVCNNCFRNTKFLVENEKPTYKEPPKEVCFYAYKRINHFREILAQFQAKETTQIPDEVLNNVKLQIKKERIEFNKVDNIKAKEILKKLGYNKYYEHIPFIKDRLGIKPPVMSPDLEDTLCNLFMEIQGPYSKYCPEDRVNFLNYYYTVYKLCELLNQTEFLPFFPMLKDREKRIEQDEVWKNICEELGWEFIATI